MVHRHVLLDDRGGITLGNRVSISDYANIYSHTHSIVDQKDVTNAPHRAGGRRAHHLPRDGAGRACGWAGTAWWAPCAVATKDVRPYHVNVGIPAKSIRIKPNAPPEAYVTERVARRETKEP